MAFRVSLSLIRNIRQLVILYPRTVSMFSKTKNNPRVLFNCSQVLGQSTSDHQTIAKMSSEQRTVVYDEVKAATQNNTVYIIDVREIAEIEETGAIPNSINIPLGDVSNVLGLPSAQFEQKVGKAKPDTDAQIIFTCRSGKRATVAADAAQKLGFTNSKIYLGSWLDWENHELH